MARSTSSAPPGTATYWRRAPGSTSVPSAHPAAPGSSHVLPVGDEAELRVDEGGVGQPVHRDRVLGVAQLHLDADEGAVQRAVLALDAVDRLGHGDLQPAPGDAHVGAAADQQAVDGLGRRGCRARWWLLLAGQPDAGAGEGGDEEHGQEDDQQLAHGGEPVTSGASRGTEPPDRMRRVDLETLAWLQTDAGRRLLEVATHAWVDHGGDPVRVATAVRRLEPDPARAAAATTQVQLRARAVAKFGELAPLMFFTPDALEQATRFRVAEHRAARLAAARPASVIDLGCGIGGDLLAFARAGLTAAGDRPRPGARRARPGQPRRARAAGRRPGRRRDDPGRVRLRRGLRRPGPPRCPGPRVRRRGLDPAVALRARPADRARPSSRSRPASRTRCCPATSRPSGSATAARSRRPRCGRPAWPPPVGGPP